MTVTGLANQAQPAESAMRQMSGRWEVRRIKDVCAVNARALPDDTDPEFAFRYADISSVDGLGKVNPSEPMAFGNAPSRARRLVRPGDSIVSTVRTYLKAIAHIGEPFDDLVVSTGFATLSPGPALMPRFLYWWLRSENFVEEIVARSVGVSYPAVNGSDIADIVVPAPPLEEQRQIVEYLDTETARIDELVAEQTQLVDLILERLASEVDRVLREGLSGSDSDPVESPWLTCAPAGWDVMRLKHCAERIVVGIVINPSSYYEDEGVPVLRGLNVRPARVNDNDLRFMSAASSELNGKSKLAAGDLVVVRTGDAGAAAVVPDWAVGGNIVDLLLIRPGHRLLSKFLEFLLNSGMVQEQVRYGSVGALQAHFNTSSLANVTVVVPPVSEQHAVVEHLEAHVEKYQQLASEARSQIELLKEHRQALITAAVTGGLEAVGRVA